MSVASEIAAYKVQVTNDVTSKTAINTISPDNVGDMGTDLADLIKPWLQIVEAGGGTISGGTAVPSDLTGANGDVYYRITSGQFYVYRKESGSWINYVNLTLGFTFPDGPLINLRVSVAGYNATVTPGGWVIDNIIYQKATQTAFVIPAPDLSFDRYDLIYADKSNQVLYQSGVASSSPAFPTTPADTIVVDYIIVPSGASGGLPYSFYGNGGASPSNTTLVIGVSDINGEFDLTSYSLGSYPIVTFYDNNGIEAPYTHDSVNKKIIYMPPSTAFSARFSN